MAEHINSFYRAGVPRFRIVSPALSPTGARLYYWPCVSAAYPKQINKESVRGFDVCSQRYPMMVDNGVVEIPNLEKPGQFEASSAEKMLEPL